MNALRQRLLDWIGRPAPAPDPEHPGANEAYAAEIHAWNDDAADTGRHHPHTVRPVGPDYTPVTPAVRQANAPTYYADRHLPAGPDDRTGVLLNPTEVK